MKIFLKKNEERRLLAGHLWIFSNEIEKVEDYNAENCIADLYTSSGRFIGKGFYNKNSLIAYRQLSQKDAHIDRNFFLKRIKSADDFRKKILKDRKVYRMINGESDYLPGLIIDKFDDFCSYQTFSLGIQQNIEIIKDILINDFGFKLIVEKNNFNLRTLEGLEKSEGIVHQDTEELIRTYIIDGIKYQIDLVGGQKTGFYLDQVESRTMIRKYVNEESLVLDLFCNDGGFSLNAAFAGAKNITAVDGVSRVIDTAKLNAGLNNFGNIEFITKDVFDLLKEFTSENKKFDIVVADPPSFTKSKANIKTAADAYIELNADAMKLINKNGILMTYSCSHHVDEKLFHDCIRKASIKVNRKIQVLETRNCSIDHPTLPAMEQTKYLKGIILRIL